MASLSAGQAARQTRLAQTAEDGYEKKAEPKATTKQIALVEDLYTDEETERICKKAKITKIEDLTVAQASALIQKRKDK